MKSREKINPAIKATPLMILLTLLIPQLFLGFFRIRDYLMIREEITEYALLIRLNYLGLPFLSAGLALLMVLWCHHKEREMPRLLMLGWFAFQASTLITFLFSLQYLTPSGIDAWILPLGTFMMLQLAATMPGLFYSLICVANVKWFNTAAASIGCSFGVLVGVPGLLFLIGNSFPYWHLPEMFIIIVSIVGTIVAAFAFLQILLWLTGKMRGGWIATLLFALIFPICGLLLNRTIPFPADLQHWAFYALAVANGTVLIWAGITNKASPFCAIATAFSYPFTCYFFFLFLPFLPFSLIAMIAAGAGFLILTPALLFILHTRQLVLQFNELKNRYSLIQLATGFLVAFLLVPAAYVGRAYYHRQIFFQTLDRVYSAPINSVKPMPSPKVSAYALQKLKDSKTGIYVPILSETYNRIVFGGMVLPDNKIKQLEQLLLGKTSENWSVNDEFSFYSFFTDDVVRRSGRSVRMPPRNVELTNTSSTSKTSNGITETTVLLTMKERSAAWQSEFVTRITLPDGVFVSGNELKIGDEMVPARMSDRRAAMWVYHMIRDRARLDPGLVIYTGPNQLKLSVFPFTAKQERQCAIRFLYPEGLSPEISIDQKQIKLSGGKPAITRIITPTGRQAVCIPAERSKQMKGTVRSLEKMPLIGTEETPGYCPEWEIKRALLTYWDSGDKQLNTVPWFITETEQPLVDFDQATWWLALNPDSGWSSRKPEQMEVIPLQAGEQIRVIPKQQGGMVIFDNTKSLNIESDTEIDAESRYAKAIDLWHNWWQTQLYPEEEHELRKDILRAAQNLNILVPSTSFLAVENTAQQKALEKAEQKSLKSHNSLAFDEFEETLDSPEPGFIFIMLLVLPFFHWIQLRRRHDENEAA